MPPTSGRVRSPLRLLLCFLIGAIAASATRADDGPDVNWRIATRDFPSVFAAWSLADNLKGESPVVTLARHDLAIEGPDAFRLRWNNRFHGLADGFTPESLAAARTLRAALRKLNPHLVLIAEIRYRDAPDNYLPADSRWWQWEGDVRKAGWAEGHYYMLDYASADFRGQVAKQAQTAMATGLFDGVFFDWWKEDDDRVALLQTVRAAIGEKALILVNTNENKAPRSAPYVNGIYMECTRSATIRDWARIAETLRWAEAALRSPRIDCLETWFHQSRQDLGLMRATTTLALTVSDGYCLFCDPDPLPTPDHLHDWYGFWDKRLGRPSATGFQRPEGAWERAYAAGSAVYNPMGNPEIVVAFPVPRRQISTGKVATSFRLPACDGDLFLKL